MTFTDSLPLPNGLILVLNNCEERLQLVLGESTDTDYSLLASRELNVPRRSANFLLPNVQQMFLEQERLITELVAIACVRGPGSFTGIRLALSAMAGLAVGLPHPALLTGLDLLPLLAAGPLALCSEPVVVLSYARRDHVYIQSFSHTANQDIPLQYVTSQEASELIQNTQQTAFLVGSGLHKNTDIFSPLTAKGFALLGKQWNFPSPEILLQAARLSSYSLEFPEPNYGRKTDAEDNLETIAHQRGLTLQEAKQQLECSKKLLAQDTAPHCTKSKSRL